MYKITPCNMRRMVAVPISTVRMADVGAELDVEAGRKAAHLAALNILAVVRPRALAAWVSRVASLPLGVSVELEIIFQVVR
jgi:hypothetical protein